MRILFTAIALSVLVSCGGGGKSPASATATAPVDNNAAPDAIAAAARGALDRLVTNGTINQSQANTIERDVAAGSADPKSLVADGVVTGAQMQAVKDAVDQAMRSFASTSGGTSGSTKP